MRTRPILAYLLLAYGWTWITVLPLLLQKRGVVDLGLPDAWEAVGWPDWSALGRSERGTLEGLLDLVLVASLLQALGEEPGWRGLLLPRLRERFRPLAATLLLFPAWLTWLWERTRSVWLAVAWHALK